MSLNKIQRTDSECIHLIAYRGDKAACWFYRLHTPLIYLAKNNPKTFNVTVSSAITNDHLSTHYDVILLQRQYKYDVLAPMIAQKKRGIKLIYEIDDNLFDVPTWNPAHKILCAPNVQSGIKRFLKEVDALFVTTEDLKDVYKEYCEHIYVLPNSIDYSVVYKYKPNNLLPVVSWQGSATHEKDLAVAKKGFLQLAKDPDLIFKLWCGIDYRTNKPLMDVPGAEIIQLVPFEAFFPMVSQLGIDIGLAPLSANKFNRGKSNLKFLEYTSQGAVTVASAFGEYKRTIEDGVTGILVEDNRDWYDKVRYLIDNPDKKNEILRNAEKLVNEEYNIEKNYIYWQNAIEDVVKN